MMMKLHISEILNLVNKAKDNQEKIKVLKQHDSPSLRQVLFANFSSRVKFLLPKEPTPYKKSKFPVALGDASLLREARRLYLFVEGGHRNLSQLKRELLWVQLLEALPVEEAEVLESLKNKELGKKYGMSKSLVVRCYPELFVGEDPVVDEALSEKAEKKSLEKVLDDASKELGLNSSVEEPVKKKRGRPPKKKD